MRMRLLLVGGESALGKALIAAGAETGVGFRTPAVPADGWTAASLTAALDAERPDAVINLAYYAAWFQDTGAIELSRQLPAIQRLAGLCQHYQIPLLQPCSYRVFDGSRLAGYSEKDLPQPVGARGEALWRLEQQVRALSPMHILLRLGWVLDDTPGGLLARLLADLQRPGALPLAVDRRGNPTTVSDAARVFLAVVKQLDCGAPLWGTYHYGAQEAVSQAGLVEAVAGVWREFARPVRAEVQELTHADLADVAQEPQNGVLIGRKLLNTFGIKARRWHAELPGLLHDFHSREIGGDD